jgi:hypothetical protein
MKLILLTFSMLMAGAVYTPPVNNAPNDISDNPYILVDTESVEKNYIRYYGHSTIGSVPEDLVIPDNQFANTQAMMEAKYPAFKTKFLFKDQRSILGFDAPTMSSISRLTIKIRFKTFAKIDFLNLVPKYLEETFVIQAANRYQPYSYYSLHGANGVADSNNKTEHMENFSIPYIGSVGDILLLEDNLENAIPNDDSIWNITRSEKDFRYVIDNPALGKNYYSISSSNLATKDFYVIMPCFFDVNRVWISVAGEDTDGNPIKDGLDSSGVPFTKDIGGTSYKYIDLDSDSVRSVYFSDTSTIVSIEVTGDDVGGHENEPYIRFGSYNFQNDSFDILLKEYWITDTGEYINSVEDRFVVLPGYDAVVSYVFTGDAKIRVSYQSDGFAVYQNVVGNDGIENPSEGTSAPGDSSSWWDDYLLNPLSDVFSTITLVLRIVLLVAGLGLIAWAVILIVRSLNKSKKGGKK